MKRTSDGKAHGSAVGLWLHRSGFISGVLAVALLAAEMGRGGISSELAACHALTVRYDATNGGRLIIATCWSDAPVVGPVILHYELDLHLMISIRRVDEQARMR